MGVRLSDDEWQRTRAALEAHGWNIAAAARALGEGRKTISNRLAVARKSGLLSVDHEDNQQRDAASSIPFMGIVKGEPPDAYKVRGTSTLYDADGNIKCVWEKCELDNQKRDLLIKETIAAMALDIASGPKTISPTNTIADLLVAYQIGDLHLGSFAWSPECSGGNFDVSIAEADLMTAVDRMIEAAPAAKQAIVVNVGDWFHTDTSLPFTPASGNLLDVGDSRWQKVIASGVKLQRSVCKKALEKHEIVRLRNARGNHDPHSSTILDVAMQAYFEEDIAAGRLIVEASPRDMFWFEFGNNLIAITHGHNVKADRLPGLLAVDAREAWGRCRFRHIWMGHFHAKKVLDIMETRVTIWPTLAPNDKWHTDKGYRSLKEMNAVVIDKRSGVREEHVIGLDLVRALQNEK